jgi:hypothetical protein
MSDAGAAPPAAERPRKTAWGFNPRWTAPRVGLPHPGGVRGAAALRPEIPLIAGDSVTLGEMLNSAI